MKYLDRIRNAQSGIDSTSKSEQPYSSEPPEPLKEPSGGFRGCLHRGTPLFLKPLSLKSPSGLCPTCSSNHYWLAPAGWQCWGCTEPEPRATTLCLPASQPTPDTSGNIPYRLNIGNVTRLVWLPPGLEPTEALRQARAIYPDLDVTDSPPPHGWPRLADIPEIPASGTPPPVECWTPSGKRLVVTACSAEHAEAIRRMNPPPVTLAEKQAQVARLIASGMTVWNAWQQVDGEVQS